MRVEPTIRRHVSGVRHGLAPSPPGSAGEVRPGKRPAHLVLFFENEFELGIVQRYLRRDFQMTSASSSAAAAALAERADVLVLRLSSGCGAEPVRVARRESDRAGILALTDDPEIAMAAYHAGADIVAQLPIDFDLLCCTARVLADRVTAAGILEDEGVGIA